MNLKDRSQRPVLVTGASKGIGRAIALRLARDGYTVAAHYVSDKKGGEEIVAEMQALGVQTYLLRFDIANRAETRAALEEHCSAHGAFWGVVQNAGISRDNAFPAIDEEGWDSVLHTNLDGFYNVLHPLVMPMIRRRDGGRIVAMSSVSGLMGNRGQVNYSAAKAGIIGAAKALAVELAKRNITVNCVAPGIIETAMTQEIMREEVLNQVPMRRAGQPEEVASAVSFLLSEEAGYITRQVISVNGGLA